MSEETQDESDSKEEETIWVYKEDKHILDVCKVHKREPYKDVLSRILVNTGIKDGEE